MPVKMKLLARTEAPSEETPPSTRPSSAASNSTSNSGPQRSTSMDSINTSSSLPEKPAGEEVIPTRFNRSSPRVNVMASMQFVKTKPAALYKSARDQIQKAETVKTLRKTSLQEEEDYKVTIPARSGLSDDQDWQSNLDKWKNSRRKLNEDLLERVIESKKFEEDTSRGRRKSKTFSEMRQQKDKRGRRYNLVVHDDDNDLTDLGLTPSVKSSIEEQPEEIDVKEVDNKDAKSDAGFCTGSDTGSDGVFAEDNISDTSSALGDKKEPIELIQEISTSIKTREINGISDKAPVYSRGSEAALKNEKYTLDKAIEQYKQFTERTKKSASMSNVAIKIAADNDKDTAVKAKSNNKLNEKLDYFNGELTREERIVPTLRPEGKEGLKKIDVKKRRSLFEMQNINVDYDKTDPPKSTIEMSESLKYKVSSLSSKSKSTSSIIPQRDAKFKEKLAAFNKNNYSESFFTKVLDRDQNIQGFSKKQPSSVESKASLIQKSSLKQKIASFEKHSTNRTKSISTECLSNVIDTQYNSLSSTNKVLKRSPSTPFLGVDIESKPEDENSDYVHLRNITKNSDTNNRKTVYEKIEKCELKRDIESAPIYNIFNHNESQESVDNSNGNYKITNSGGDDNIWSNTYLPMENGLLKQMDSFCDNHNVKPNISTINSEEIMFGETGFQSKESVTHLPPCSSNCDLNGDDMQLDFDSLETKEEYGDDDIDEVIHDYENMATSSPKRQYLSNSTCNEMENSSSNYTYETMDSQIAQENIYEQLDDASLLSKDKHLFNNTSLLDHTYQSISDHAFSNDHTYQTINDKTVTNDNNYQNWRDTSSMNDHTYQSLDNFQEQLKESSPSLPPKKSSGLSLEVLDVSWTEDGGRANLAIPPSVPPPPPPIDDEEGLVVDSDVVTDAETLYSPRVPWDGFGVERSSYSENPQPKVETDNKISLMMKRSEFLGMSTPFVVEEVSAKPPPDMKEFIRQERDSERQLIQNNSRKCQSDNELAIPARHKYTWEDRMREDASNDFDASDTSSNLNFQCKLAELEREMQEHDREMLHRLNQSDDGSELVHIEKLSGSLNSNFNESDTNVPTNSQMQQENNVASTSKSVPIQEFYSTPSTIDCFQSKSKASIANDSSSKKIWSLISSPNVQPPRKPSRSTSEIGSVGNHLNKPNIKALSAIPKPKRVENDSWIAKKKSDTSKKNYNNHWLIQEAEQRRLDSLARQTSSPVLQFRPSNLLPAPVHYSTAQQPPSQLLGSIKTPQLSSKKPVIPYPSKNVYSSDNSNIYANASNYSNPSSNSSSENINCKMKGVTYSPQKPNPPQKPLPASIISSITQRVSSKGRMNNNSDRPILYNSRISNHDYMNSETIEAHRNQSEINPNPLTYNLINARHATASIRNSSQNAAPLDQPPTSTSSEEQRLLSVSGKKKCSHCSDELGRGAAMIIESLRLFYHIPCFKCCVCGIQLGNGTAGADVRVRNHKLHCHNCYSNDEGMKFSKV